MLQEKKIIQMPPVRIEEGIWGEHIRALEFYGIDRPSFVRKSILAIIHHAKRNDQLVYPLRFVTTCNPTNCIHYEPRIRD